MIYAITGIIPAIMATAVIAGLIELCWKES
jgi:hypothetical protein